MRAAGPELKPIELDLDAAGRVMDCSEIGLRAYAVAGGLDPAVDFRGLDLRGLDLAEQDLAGFDLSGCDLRGTNIERARIGADTRLERVTLDPEVTPGALAEAEGLLRSTDLAALVKRAGELHDRHDAASQGVLAEAGAALLPLMQRQFGRDRGANLTFDSPPDSAETNLLTFALFVSYGNLRTGAPAIARTRLLTLIDRWRSVVGIETEWRLLLARFYAAEAVLDLGRPNEALQEFDALLSLVDTVDDPQDTRALAARCSRARALLDLGRAEETLRELNALLPIYEKLQGPRDPGTLTTRHVRARALLELGSANEAAGELAAVNAAYAEINGAAHWWIALTRAEEIAAEMQQGKVDFAGELGVLASQIAQATSGTGLHVAPTRYRRARCLIATGNKEAALSEIDTLLKLFERAGIRAHRYRTATERLLRVLDGSDDGAGLPP